MNILIDADGCPVVDLTLQIAKRFGISVIILCDTSNQIEREGTQTLVFDKGSDILLLRPLCAPLGVLSGTEELFVFITPQHESVYVVGGVF